MLSVGLILVTVASFDVWMSRAIAQYVTVNIRDDLYVRAAVAAREASQLHAPFGDVAAWDGRADELAKTLAARVTFIAPDGSVMGDSVVDRDGLAKMENHRDRPEVVEALRTGRGSDERVSATLQIRWMYVAVPFESATAAAIARVARPLAEVDAAVTSARRALYVGSAFAFFLAILVAAGLSQRLTSTVRDLTSVARRMAQGELDVRTRRSGSDEFGALGETLDALATGLSQTLGELRAERDLQIRILQNMQEGVLVLDDDDHVVLMNPTLCAMLLLAGADFAGKHFLEVVRISELQSLFAKARKSTDGSSAEIETGGIKPRRLLVHASALKDKEGGLLAVFVDVTDVRRLESLRRDFVANVSHELRTPVAAVLSATETLRDGGAIANPVAAERFLAIIDRNAQRLQALIEDLLELSRLDAREYHVKKERVDGAALLNIVTGLFRERAEKKNIKLCAKLPVPAPTIESDQRALEQILGNLVDNAIKYCQAGASVTIRLEEDENRRLRFLVEDTGPGIEARHLPRLFERFYRVDAGRSREVGGTGLGLSIVRHLGEAIGAEITVRSELGVGSTFIVTMPCGDPK